MKNAKISEIGSRWKNRKEFKPTAEYIRLEKQLEELETKGGGQLRFYDDWPKGFNMFSWSNKRDSILEKMNKIYDAQTT